MPRLAVYDYAQALRFNGSSDGLTVPVTPSTTNFNIAFWIYLYPFTNSARVIDYQAAGPSGGFTFVATNVGNKIDFVINNVGAEVARIGIPTVIGDWFHICVTFTTNSAKVYRNGTLLGTDTSCTMSNPSTTLTIGKRATGASNFTKMHMDQFVFENGTPWTAAQVADLYSGKTVPSTATVIYDFNQNVTDSSGNGNNGTLTGGTYVEGRTGIRYPVGDRSNKAINFHGNTAAKVTITDAAILRPETTLAFTWSQWVYLFRTNNNVLPRIFEKGSHYTCIMGDQTNGECNHVALEIIGDDAVATEYWGSTRLQPHRWYFIATTWDDGTCQHYVNGKAEVMKTIGGPYVSPMEATSGVDITIGNTDGNSRNWPGFISNVRYHNRALTATEIRTLMGGKEVNSGLIGKWNFDEGTGNPADSSGNGNNGTLTSGIWVSETVSRSAAAREAISGRSAV